MSGHGIEVVDTTTWEYQLGLWIISLVIGAWSDSLPIAVVEAKLERLQRHDRTAGVN